MIDGTARRSGPEGIALPSIVLAVGIVVLALFPILSLFFDLGRDRRTANLVRETIVANLVWKSLQAQATANPRLLGDLGHGPGWTQTDLVHPDVHDKHVRAAVGLGCFVDRDGPLDAQGNPVGLSPFARLMTVRDGLTDLAVRVTVVDGALPQWSPTGGKEAPPIAVSELVKDVLVDILRTGSDGRLCPIPAYKIRGAIETPLASLSPEAAALWRSRREEDRFQDDLATAYGSLDGGIAAARLPADRALGLAEALLIATETIGEALDTDGMDLGSGMGGPAPGRGLASWAALAATRSGLDDRVLAGDVAVEEAQRILTAAWRTGRAMDAFAHHAGHLVHRLEHITRDLEGQGGRYQSASGPDAPDIRAAATAAGRAIARSNRAELIEAAVWARVMGQMRWAAALRRPLEYPARHEAARSLARALRHGVAVDPTASPTLRQAADRAAAELLEGATGERRAALERLAAKDNPYRLALESLAPTALAPMLARIRAALILFDVRDVLALVDGDASPLDRAGGPRAVRPHRVLIAEVSAMLAAEGRARDE